MEELKHILYRKYLWHASTYPWVMYNTMKVWKQFFILASDWDWKISFKPKWHFPISGLDHFSLEEEAKASIYLDSDNFYLTLAL